MYKHRNLDCPIYWTYPVQRMGQYYLYDAYQGLIEQWVDFDHFTAQDIDEVFLKNFKTLKHSQEIKIMNDTIQITPYCAGHMIGGSMWRILKDAEEILYAIDHNHRRERHLSESMVGSFQRPTLLITDAFNLDNQATFRRSTLDLSLTNAVMETLRMNGNVLIPTDAAGRIFEIGMVLYNHWRKNNSLFAQYSLVFLSYTSRHATEMIRSMLEWMNEDCRKRFNEDRKNVFKWSKFIVARNLDELQKQAQSPMCVLASNPFCENGFSKDLLDQWCTNENNCVLLTERVTPDSVGGKLYQVMEERKLTNKRGQTIELTKRVKVQLEGEELDAWNDKMRKEKEEEEARKRMEMEIQEEESEDEEMEDLDAETNVPLVKAKYPLFNWYTKETPYDVYGAPMDFSNYEEDVEAEVVSNTRTGGPQRPNFTDPSKQPYKSILETQEMILNCDIKFVNFEGRVDGRGATSILTQVQPKKVVAVHGSAAAKTILKTFCEAELSTNLEAPDNLETIRISTSTNVYSLQLENALDKKLKFVGVKGFEDYETCYVEGIVDAAKEDEDELVLRQVPVKDKKKFQHQALYLGNVKLLDVKKSLSKSGHDARFVSNAIVAGSDETIRIEKKQNSSIRIRGTLSEDYFNVRDVLYQNYHCM